jgi:hypothetical protein
MALLASPTCNFSSFKGGRAMRRRLTVLLAIVAVAIVGLASGLSKGTSNTAEAVAVASPPQQTGTTSNDPPGTIDGAKNPELIPDEVAYSLFFSFLSDRQTEKERNSMRSYVEQTALDGLDVDTLLAIGEAFKKKAAAIDKQARALRDQNPFHPNEQAMALFREQHKAVTMEMVASLPSRLGHAGAEKVRQHILGRIKSRVKIIPGPVMPDSAHNMQH